MVHEAEETGQDKYGKQGSVSQAEQRTGSSKVKQDGVPYAKYPLEPDLSSPGSLHFPHLSPPLSFHSLDNLLTLAPELHRSTNTHVLVFYRSGLQFHGLTVQTIARG